MCAGVTLIGIDPNAHFHSQATLAALDAMRKAHQNEVQREVSRFKAEFVQQIQNGCHSEFLDGTKNEYVK